MEMIYYVRSMQSSHMTWEVRFRFSFSIRFITSGVSISKDACECECMFSSTELWYGLRRKRNITNTPNLCMYAWGRTAEDGVNNSNNSSEKKEKEILMLGISKIAPHSVNWLCTHWHTITRDSHAWLSSHAFLPALTHPSLWIKFSGTETKLCKQRICLAFPRGYDCAKFLFDYVWLRQRKTRLLIYKKYRKINFTWSRLNTRTSLSACIGVECKTICFVHIVSNC